MTDVLAVDSLFEEHRRFLWGLCYRMTGSAADAEDVVQETFVRVMERPPRRTDEPLRPWLVRVALNLARDVNRRRRRLNYVGSWLPSPIETDEHHATELEPPSHEPVMMDGRYDLLESVSFAFLVALEALTPTQRAVLLLRDVFDYSVRDTARALDLTEPNVKTTHHRARRAMKTYNESRQIPTAARQQATAAALKQFLHALQEHNVAAIESLLAEDVRLTSDGGGEFKSALRTITGRDKVTRFYFAVAENAADARVRPAMLNGTPSIVAVIPDPGPGISPRFTMTAELDASGRIAHIYVVSATRKLSRIA